MEFTELQKLYAYLEGNAGDYKYHQHIAGLFQKLRDAKHKTGQADEAEKAQWEIDCFNFMTQKGELKSLFSGTDERGQPWEYPAMYKLSDKELDYIAARLEGTSNPILKARYAHILWASRRKHEKYAKIAVDSYLELVKFYEEKDRKEPQAHYGLDVLDSAEQASFLGLKIKYRIDDIGSEKRRLVKDFNSESSSAFVMRARLIRHMLEGKADFPSECFEDFPKVCLDLGEKLFKEGKFHRAINIFEVREKVDNKLGINTHDWNRSIAESYEGLMNQRAESDLAATSFCQNAIEYYRKIKDEKKTRELGKKYDQLKGKQQFKKISLKIDQTEYRKKCRETADDLCAEEPGKIISFLISSKDLVPSYKAMAARSEETNEKTVFRKIVPASVTDRYGHTAEHFETEEEKEYFGILEQYAFEMQLGGQILINEVFLKAVENGKLNIYTTMGFFEKHSWYGKNIPKVMPNDQRITYNWLNLIAPGLNEYFNQLNAHFLEPAYAPNVVLAMDSLALKIEGLVRDICVLSGISTFYQLKDKQGRNIVREKDLNWLLREEPIKKLFDEDDLLFFKYVLVEKAGLNLRHKIAHCLIDYSEYNISYMNLLLLVLFRLGRYDFVKPDETVEEKVADPGPEAVTNESPT
jgi:hypothetical protein